MNIQTMLLATTVTFAGLTVAATADAAVVVGIPVNGLATFTDTNTGYNWVKLNAFSNQSYTAMAATANAAGFSVATLSDVQTLLGSLPLNSNTFASYNDIMGGSSSRPLLWGAYGPATNNRIGWAYASIGEPAWRYNSNVTSVSAAYSDMGIFAFRTGAVPEPATWGMIILGFGIIGAAVRYRRRSTRLAYTPI